MATYVITGVSRGIGWEFLRQISADGKNKVIGIVRNKTGTEKKVAEELDGRTNITILEGDLNDFESLKAAAAATSEITGGSLDYLIANAAYMSNWEAFDDIGTLTDDQEKFIQEYRGFMDTNILGNIYLIKFFLPLILKGTAKKVIHITSGHADLEPIRNFDVDVTALYAISKAGMNVAIGKYSAQYRSQGVLFLSLSPGVVDVGHFDEATPEQLQKAGALFQKFKAYSPTFQGPQKAHDSIRDMLATISRASIEGGFAGAYVSHNGDKQWV